MAASHHKPLVAVVAVVVSFTNRVHITADTIQIVIA